MLLLPNELLLMLTIRRVVLRTNNIWVSHSLNILINEICNVESMLSLEILCCHKTIFAAQKRREESPLTDQLFFVWLKYFLMTVLLTWWCWCWHKSPCFTQPQLADWGSQLSSVSRINADIDHRSLSLLSANHSPRRQLAATSQPIRVLGIWSSWEISLSKWKFLHAATKIVLTSGAGLMRLPGKPCFEGKFLTLSRSNQHLQSFTSQVLQTIKKNWNILS